MANQIYLTPTGGTTSSPVTVIKSDNNQYSWEITSNISGTLEASLYADAYKAPSIWGESIWLLSQPFPYADANDGVNMGYQYGYMDIRPGSGYTLTLTIPTDYPYVHIYALGSIVNGSYDPDMVTFDYWFHAIDDPVTLSEPGIANVSQSGQNFVVSWTPATGSGGSGDVTYTVVYGDEGDIYEAGTSTNATIPIHSSYWGTSVRFRIHAEYSGKQSSSASYKYFTPSAPSVSVPSNLTVTQSGSQITVSWGASTGSYGSGSVTYQVIYGDSTNGYEAYSKDVGTNRSTTITQWITPYGDNVTCQFKVKAIYSGVSNTSSAVHHTLVAPVLSWENRKLAISQVGTQVKVSWTSATLQGGTATITYYLYCGSDIDGAIWSGTRTEATITPSAYDTEISFYVLASVGDVAPGAWSETKRFTAQSPSVSLPGKPTITQSGSQFTISWAAATGSYGTGDVTYKVFMITDGEFVTDSLRSTSATLNVPAYDVDLGYQIVAYYSGLESQSESTGVRFIKPNSTIMYYNGSSWIECIVYYFNGIDWIECIPYYYDGTSWKECSQ